MNGSPSADGGAVPSPRNEGRAMAGEGTRPPTGLGDNAESPAVPLFRTWRGVYWFVFGCFAAMVIALTLFTRYFA